MKKILLVFLILNVSCQNNIHISVDRDFNNKKNLKNDKFMLFFEQLFQDTVKIDYNNREIFKKYLVTDKRLNVCVDVCVIDSIYKDKLIYLKIDGKEYHFKPKQKYRYYYFSKFNEKVGVVYSNIKREYY